MLIAKRKGFFSRSYEIMDESEQSIVELAIKGLSLKASFTFNKLDYEFKSNGMFSSTYEMLESGKVVGSAELVSVLKSNYILDLSGRKLKLEKKGILSKDYAVFFDEYLQGSIYPQSTFSPLANIDLPQDWPFPFRMFIFWLVLNQWVQMEAAAS